MHPRLVRARPRASTLLLIGSGLALACSNPAAPAQPAPSPAPASSLVRSSAPAASEPAVLGPEAAGGLIWASQPPLVRRPPKSSMRAAEYSLANAPEAELGVFYFGADQGGSVDANLRRWLGQFTQPDGSDTSLKAHQDELRFHGVAVTTIEVTGNYSGGMAPPGGGAPSPITDAMLLGAIANGPKGPVFFKLVGPRAALEGARGAFRGLLESLQVDPALSR
jgi:hypothetical protein